MTTDTVEPIKYSKLYDLARSTALLSALVPPINVQIAVEQEITENFPRTEKDGEDTRIFIHYTNERGGSATLNMPDAQRLEQVFNIDEFLAGYEQRLYDTNLPEDPVERVTTVIMACLVFSLLSVLGVDRESSTGRPRVIAGSVLQALVAILYDDSKDVMILAKDKPNPTTGERTIEVYHMWALTLRN